MKNKIIITMLIILCAFGAQAHKLNVLAFAENDTLTLNSYFADGTPCKECSFKVTDGSGKVFAEGKLAEDGTYTKNGTLPAKLDVVVDAGLGHRAEQTIDVKTGAESGGESASDDSGQTTSADSGEIRKIVREELTRQTAEITAAIDKNNSMSGKIIAGIGYVLGIFGLMVLFRKK